MTELLSGHGKFKAIAIIAAKIALSGGLLFWLWTRLPPSAEWPPVRLADPALALACAALAFVQFAVLALRWRLTAAAVLPASQDIPGLGRFLAVTWLSSAVGQVLPALIGSDGLRIAALRFDGIPWLSAAASVVVDRLIGLVGLLVLLVSVLAVDPLWSGVQISGIYLAAGLGALVLLLFYLKRRKPAALLSKIPPKMADLAGWKGAMFIVIAVVGHALSIVIFVLLARSLSLDVPAAAAVAVFPLALLVSMLPVTLGGWGVRELAVVHGLSLYGVAQQDALLASVFFGIFQFGVAIPAVAYVFIWPGRIKR